MYYIINIAYNKNDDETTASGQGAAKALEKIPADVERYGERYYEKNAGYE